MSGLNINFLNNEVTDESRRVPYDLIPVLPTEAHFNWGVKTYKYYHLFDDNIKKDYFRNDEEVIGWMQYANNLQDELRETGVLKATQHILHLCKNEFNMTGTDGQDPHSISDVVNIVRDSGWYKDDVNRSRYIVYMMSYGIFRNGYNSWIHEAVSEWIKGFKIAYKPLDSNTLIANGHQRQGKGFVYRLLTTRATNSMSNRFQEVTKSAFGEYIRLSK